MRLPSADDLIIVSHDESYQIMEDYSKIWKIEVLFQSLKERGFNFEDANLKDEECLKRLLAVITIAFCWAYTNFVYLIQYVEGVIKDLGGKYKINFG